MKKLGHNFKASRVWRDIVGCLPDYIHDSPEEIQELIYILRSGYQEGQLSIETERQEGSINGEKFEDDRGYEHIIVEDWRESKEELDRQNKPQTDLILSTSTRSYRIQYIYRETSSLGPKGCRKKVSEDSRWRDLIDILEDDVDIDFDQINKDPYFR